MKQTHINRCDSLAYAVMIASHNHQSFHATTLWVFLQEYQQEHGIEDSEIRNYRNAQRAMDITLEPYKP